MNHASIEHATENFSGHRKRLPAKPFRQVMLVPPTNEAEAINPALIVLDADCEFWRRDDYRAYHHWWPIDNPMGRSGTVVDHPAAQRMIELLDRERVTR